MRPLRLQRDRLASRMNLPGWELSDGIGLNLQWQQWKLLQFTTVEIIPVQIHPNLTIIWQLRMQVGGSLVWLCLLLRWVCIEVFECFLNWDTANTKLEIKLRWLFECVSIVDFLHGWFFFGSESRDQTSFSGAVLPNQFFWGSVTKPDFLGQCSTGCKLHILGVRQRHRVGPWESPAWLMLKSLQGSFVGHTPKYRTMQQGCHM